MGNVRLTIPTEPVGSKLLCELYSKFTPSTQSQFMFWSFADNFQNTYIRFINRDGNVIENLLPELDKANKNEFTKQVVKIGMHPNPTAIQAAMLVDLDQFQETLFKKPGKTDDFKLCGIRGNVILEPTYPNTYVHCRISFPNYTFEPGKYIDLNGDPDANDAQTDVNGAGKGKSRSQGEYFVLEQFDQLVNNTDMETMEVDVQF